MNIVKENNIYPYVLLGFSEDSALTSTWHIEAGNGLYACVNRTVDDLRTTTHSSFTFFVVEENNDIIGFFGREHKNYVNTIFVRPKYRKKERMKKFWDVVKENMDAKFYTALYEKNTPAIDFYKKQGGKIIDKANYKGNNVVIIEVGE